MGRIGKESFRESKRFNSGRVQYKGLIPGSFLGNPVYLTGLLMECENNPFFQNGD